MNLVVRFIAHLSEHGGEPSRLSDGNRARMSFKYALFAGRETVTKPRDNRVQSSKLFNLKKRFRVLRSEVTDRRPGG
jgi:hypothetical protein